MRVFTAAAVQFAASAEPDENRDRCLELLAQAAGGGADLVVFPEFSHCAPVYPTGAQAHPHAVHPEHPFLVALQAAARRHRVWVAVNAFEQGPFPQVFGTTFLLSAAGEMVGRYRKHLLFGPERSWLTPARDGHPVFPTPLGRLGMFICMDGLIPEPARCLAVAGAEVLLNCLNSGGPDEPALHIPARALENGVWVVAANKVGPVFHAHAARYVGGSMVVRPDGTVAAQADGESETVVLAEVDPGLVDRSRLAARRPAAYASLYRPPARRLRLAAPSASPGADLVAGTAAPVPGAWTVAAVDGAVVAFDPAGGVAARYRPVHGGGGEELAVLELPWGRLGLSGGDDLWYPEAARCLALGGADLLVHLGDWRELLLVERAAENRLFALAVAPGRCGLARLGPLQTVPHWRARQPDLEVAPSLEGEVDLVLARVKGDQLAGRCAEDCGALVEPPAFRI